MKCNPNKKEFETIISKINYLSEGVMEITFKIINSDRMCFSPGQFIIIKISNEPMIMRTYSVLNYNIETNEISVAIKKVEGGQGTSIIFENFKVGMKVDIMGAMGKDLIVNKDEKNLVLVATGIGVTPILCILNDLVNSKYEGNITFIYGARTKAELFYLEDIQNIEQNNQNINFIPVLSREELDGYRKGYVTNIINDINLNDKYIYMCCSRSVAMSFKEALERKGFDLSRFKCESA